MCAAVLCVASCVVVVSFVASLGNADFNAKWLGRDCGSGRERATCHLSSSRVSPRALSRAPPRRCLERRLGHSSAVSVVGSGAISGIVRTPPRPCLECYIERRVEGCIKHRPRHPKERRLGRCAEHLLGRCVKHYLGCCLVRCFEYLPCAVSRVVSRVVPRVVSVVVLGAVSSAVSGAVLCVPFREPSVRCFERYLVSSLVSGVVSGAVLVLYGGRLLAGV